MTGRIGVRLNQQQLELVDLVAGRLRVTGRAEALVEGLRRFETSAPAPPAPPAQHATPPARKVLDDLVIEPGTGKALGLASGHVLRVSQTAGGQCADLNLFNLDDYREAFHAGRTRAMHGVHPTAGDLLWSAPPRERPMAAIVTDTARANDVLFPRCSGFLFEFGFGLPVHTNCHDIQVEAQREYGLTPDDVHDSFNLFMNTGVDADGRQYIAERNTAGPDDHVELLALMDLLAVPNVCGSDVLATSGFELKPLRLTVMEAAPEDWALVDSRRELRPLRTQRSPSASDDWAIKVERELRRDPDYEPDFTNVPLEVSTLELELDDADVTLIERLQATGRYGDDPGTVVRAVWHTWCARELAP